MSGHGQWPDMATQGKNFCLARWSVWNCLIYSSYISFGIYFCTNTFYIVFAWIYHVIFVSMNCAKCLRIDLLLTAVHNYKSSYLRYLRTHTYHIYYLHIRNPVYKPTLFPQLEIEKKYVTRILAEGESQLQQSVVLVQFSAAAWRRHWFGWRVALISGLESCYND